MPPAMKVNFCNFCGQQGKCFHPKNNRAKLFFMNHLSVMCLSLLQSRKEPDLSDICQKFDCVHESEAAIVGSLEFLQYRSLFPVSNCKETGSIICHMSILYAFV